MPIQTECGLVLHISTTYKIYNDIYESLKKLQHRGRESFGIGYISDQPNSNYSNFQNITIEKHIGEVKDSILTDEIKRINSKIWFGHVRYSTSGNKITNTLFTQPILISFLNIDDLSIIYNGNIPFIEWEKVFKKYPELKNYYYRNKSSINDTFLIIEFLKILKLEYFKNNKEFQGINKNNNYEKIINNVLIKFVQLVERAYSLVLISNTKCWIIEINMELDH